MLELLVFLIPIYVANSSPVVLGGGAPLDFNIRLSDGRRIFGKGKTIRGFIGGVLAGTLAGALVALVYQLPYFPDFGIQIMAAFLLSVGTLAGDAIGSFLKRRLQMESGSQFMPDTFIFLVVSLAFVYPIANSSLFEPLNIIFFLLLTIILHPLTNLIANRVGLKKVPW
jgi:CDP-2,3-bis-(O-geranylgeranyl)-sn-glycerol synthase